MDIMAASQLPGAHGISLWPCTVAEERRWLRAAWQDTLGESLTHLSELLEMHSHGDPAKPHLCESRVLWSLTVGLRDGRDQEAVPALRSLGSESTISKTSNPTQNQGVKQLIGQDHTIKPYLTISLRILLLPHLRLCLGLFGKGLPTFYSTCAPSSTIRA